jgi:hypothetical protein
MEQFMQARPIRSPNTFRFPRNARRPLIRSVAVAGVLLAALLAPAVPAAAAEVLVRGDATFKVPAEATLAALPADAPVRAADLRGGTLSFELSYDDATPDADADPQTGRYERAIRAFRVRIGDTLLDMPVSSARLVVSDGGQGRVYRESVQFVADARAGGFTVQAGWVQLNQAAMTADLRGATGVLDGDRLPAPSRLVALPTSGEFDRVFYLRIDAQGDAARPLLYLSTSKLSVGLAGPATAAAGAPAR